MAIPNVMLTGRNAMAASQAAISTTGHNIANANTDGFSRQRVIQSNAPPQPHGKHWMGTGTQISRSERINNEYLEKQLRNSNRELGHAEEKDVTLKQVEDIFNEMNGDGLNRLMAKFFNDFRKLANEPDSESVRQSVRESAQAMVNDFHRLRSELEETRHHVDSRIEGYVAEVNARAKEIRELNSRIQLLEVTGGSPNDLLDTRDRALKDLAGYLDISAVREARTGALNVDIRGIGVLVNGPIAVNLSTNRSPADDMGKTAGSLEVRSDGSASGDLTHLLKGGKLGALLEVRDHTLTTVTKRIDELAASVVREVNNIHAQGVDRFGNTGIKFFNDLPGVDRAAELLQFSEPVRSSVNHIVTAVTPDAPGDNRVALAIANLQNGKLMSDGRATVDDYFNSMVADVGVAAARNRATLNQQRDIKNQVSRMREQISGVSIDEETANLLQFHHNFEAAARLIGTADEMLRTVLDLKKL